MSVDLSNPIPISEASPLEQLMFDSMHGEKAPYLQLETYRELVRDLPPPTGVQMRTFAEYVSTGKSWYKHLPISPPGEVFHFYLHPYAGCSRLLLESGHAYTVERTNDTPSCHYSWMTTDEYRERFGYLAFSGLRNTGMFVPVEAEGSDAILDSNPAMPIIQISPDTACRPAQEILSAGECRVTALLHPRLANSSYIQHQLLTHLSTAEPTDDDPTWAAIIEHCQTLATDGTVHNTSHSDEIADDKLTKLLARKRMEYLTAAIEAMRRMCGLVYSS